MAIGTAHGFLLRQAQHEVVGAGKIAYFGMGTAVL